MARRMRDPGFQKEQQRNRLADHIAPLNLLVDELRQGSWAPYIAPMYGGTSAKLLYVLRDPGPMTQDEGGSGFLCWENDDPTAETLCMLFSEVGIKASDVVPWNAYPWYINRNPKAAELERGVEPLKRVIDLLPDLRIVMLLGRSAQSGWKRLSKRYPGIEEARDLSVIKTYHTSRQAFWHQDEAVREKRRADQRQAFYEAANLLQRPTNR